MRHTDAEYAPPRRGRRGTAKSYGGGGTEATPKPRRFPRRDRDAVLHPRRAGRPLVGGGVWEYSDRKHVSVRRRRRHREGCELDILARPYRSRRPRRSKLPPIRNARAHVQLREDATRRIPDHRAVRPFARHYPGCAGVETTPGDRAKGDVVRNRVICGAIAPIRAHDHRAAAWAGPFRCAGARATRRAQTRRTAAVFLAGVRIIDSALLGPAASPAGSRPRSEVIKVEGPGGDYVARWRPDLEDLAASTGTSMRKQSIVLDLKTPEGSRPTRIWRAAPTPTRHAARRARPERPRYADSPGQSEIVF